MRKIPKEILAIRDKIEVNKGRISLYNWLRNACFTLAGACVVAIIFFFLHGVVVVNYLCMFAYAPLSVLLLFLFVKLHNIFDEKFCKLKCHNKEEEHRWHEKIISFEHSDEFIFYGDFEERIRERMR